MSADTRTLKALEIAQTSGTWRQLRTRDGELVFAIPSQTTRGLYYLVTTSSCTCKDAHHHGLRAARIGMTGVHTACKHVRALALSKVLNEGVDHDLVLERLPSGEYTWLKAETNPDCIFCGKNGHWSAECPSTPARATQASCNDDAFWSRFEDR